jgi:anti-sigma regulatory factor (Ser/Thr protein kinase)
MDLLIPFSSAPASVSALRRQVAEVLSEMLAVIDCEAVVLLTSELATNAINHALPPYTLGVAVHDRTVRIEVTDHSDGVPAVLHPEPTEPGGRGMLIIDQLADGWGVDWGAGSKTVWVELRR